MGVSRPLRTAQSGWRRQHQTQAAGEEDVTSKQFLGLEASLLSSHRLPNKQMQLMNRNLHRLQQTLRQGFANVETQFTNMNNNMVNLTTAINDLCREMVADRAHARRRERNTAARLDRLSHSIGRLAVVV
ncbi:hypothetical protein NDU88_002707 [Pleurodeles waltl]|uniref:Uncharacterized protein n=1 Tax=Pleurodeles waltl TaxID=8319 RepID=A0AAV7T3A8_PLEWA|nr:hypothetical protein NDU88_002707 [Pleurodeles waltl]